MSIKVEYCLDGYKVDHRRCYPKNTSLVYSNWTPRKSRMSGVNKVVFFGLQYFIKKYLIEEWNNFFNSPLESTLEKYKNMLDTYLGPNNIDVNHLSALHKLGYMPIEIRALPEGVASPIGIPQMTIKNTHPDFFWLTNYLETIISCILWQPSTSATIANEFRKKLLKGVLATNSEAKDFLPWQAHDFSFRGMSSLESACLSGAGHLTSFNGTDTIPAIKFVEQYYHETVGGSVPATEHSVMCLSSAHSSEIDTFKRLLCDLYPTGIVSIVSDTWNLWKVVTEFLPQLSSIIQSRPGKLVIRPDSSRTTPQDIICGTPKHLRNWNYDNDKWNKAEELGLVQALWDLFGGTYTKEGFKQLNEKIGIIYGDGITLDRCEEINIRLMTRGFTTTNVVYGVGSYTYQYNTRDTFGFAIKATYGEVDSKAYNIFKDPLTDDGEKKSAKGLLMVDESLTLHQEVSEEQEKKGMLELVFKDGKLLRDMSMTQVRENILKYS